MSEATEYVLVAEKDKTRAAEIARSVANKLQRREVTLLETVQSVGEFLQEDDDSIRARAVSFLASVVGDLPPTFLSRQQIQVLCDFFCNRIEDGGAIEGLHKLQSSDRFTKEMAQTVVRALFSQFVDLKARGVAVRFHVYKFLDGLLDQHRKALRDMGDEALVGITDLVGGEKDPRNLMVVFSMLRVIMLEWDISNHVDTMFDAVYAYFPITFRPHPNDPYGITAQDLKDRLRDCLSSSSLLAPNLIPGLLEKLDSTSTMTKRDVMQTMTACAEHYDPSVLSQYCIPLWDALKFEVLSAQEPELAEEALMTLRCIGACLSRSTNNSPTTSPLALYLRPITKECLEHFQEPAQRQARASSDILRMVGAANESSFDYIVKKVARPILTIYQSANGIVQQRAVLEIINQLFESAILVFGSWSTAGLADSSEDSNPMVELRDQLIALYGQALMGTIKEEVSLRLVAAKGLLLLARLRSFLQENEIGLFVQYFNDIILNEESYGRDELKSTALSGLAEISKAKSRLISDITFPAFMARLPDDEREAASTDYYGTLEGLAQISVEKELQETLIRRLLNKLDILLNSTTSGPFPYTCAVLSTVFYLMERATVEDAKTSTVLDLYFDRVVVGYDRLVRSCNELASAGAFSDPAALDLIGRMDSLIIRNSAKVRLPYVADNIYNLFGNNQDETFTRDNQDQPSWIVSTWLLAALPRDFAHSRLQAVTVVETIESLINLTRFSHNYHIGITSLRQIALYVNKHIANSDLERLQPILSELYHTVAQTLLDTELSKSIRLIFTIVKALVLRLVPHTNTILSELVSLLDTSKYGTQTARFAATGFSSLLSTDDVLSPQNFAQIRLLAPQRIFQTLIPLISEKFKATIMTEEKQNYLTALSGIVGTVPAEIIMPEMQTLLPLLLQSLDLSDQAVKIATLETIAVVITNNPAALEESGHIAALVKRLIASCSLYTEQTEQTKVGPVSNLPKTKMLAARCLSLLPSHISGSTSRTNPLLALKKDVVYGLLKALDDPRRDVRKEAVDARNTWIRNLDDPDEDDDD